MTAALLIVIGVAAGALATSLGVGGGIIFVPALVIVLGFDQHLAEGTSLAVIAATAAIGTWIHHRHGRIDWRVAAFVAGGGIAGAIAGSVLALRLDPGLLRRLFAVFLAIVALRLLRHVARSR